MEKCKSRKDFNLRVLVLLFRRRKLLTVVTNVTSVTNVTKSDGQGAESACCGAAVVGVTRVEEVGEVKKKCVSAEVLECGSEEVEEVKEEMCHCEPSLARRGNPRLRYILEIALSFHSSQ